MAVPLFISSQDPFKPFIYSLYMATLVPAKDCTQSSSPYSLGTSGSTECTDTFLWFMDFYTCLDRCLLAVAFSLFVFTSSMLWTVWRVNACYKRFIYFKGAFKLDHSCALHYEWMSVALKQFWTCRQNTGLDRLHSFWCSALYHNALWYASTLVRQSSKMNGTPTR